MSPRILFRPESLSAQEFRLTRAMMRHVRSGQIVRADEEIDRRVYVLYGLSEEEIKIIE